MTGMLLALMGKVEVKEILPLGKTLPIDSRIKVQGMLLVSKYYI